VDKIIFSHPRAFIFKALQATISYTSPPARNSRSVSGQLLRAMHTLDLDSMEVSDV